MKKKILIICGVLLIVGIVGAGTFKYYVKPKYVAPLVVALEEFLLEDKETVDLLIKEYEKGLEEQKDANIGKETNADQTTNLGQAINDNQKTNIVQETNIEQETITQIKDKPVVGGKSISEIQKEVESGDLKAGLSIASKIDTGHLMGLAKGGLTTEDKKQAKEYLKGTLTPGEYSQLKYFVGKYAHLLK